MTSGEDENELFKTDADASQREVAITFSRL